MLTKLVDKFDHLSRAFLLGIRRRSSRIDFLRLLGFDYGDHHLWLFLDDKTHSTALRHAVKTHIVLTNGAAGEALFQLNLINKLAANITLGIDARTLMRVGVTDVELHFMILGAQVDILFRCRWRASCALSYRDKDRISVVLVLVEADRLSDLCLSRDCPLGSWEVINLLEMFCRRALLKAILCLAIELNEAGCWCWSLLADDAV